MGETFALVGAQWGSEGKGVIAAALAYRFDAAVRVGGPNAGHSFYYDGRKYVARSVPCAWINPSCTLIFGAGGVINPVQLQEELSGLPDRVRILVDSRAACILPEYEHRELENIRAKIGSTAEGVGLARIAKIARDGAAVLARDWDGWQADGRVDLGDTWLTLQTLLAAGDDTLVFLEGTQGSGLSINHGTEYPYATSSDTNVSGLLSDAGIPPEYSGHVQLVARSYPIRVAGNSGPMGEETSWESLGVEPEITTVTKKVRRVAQWNDDVFGRAMWHNAPCGVWLTFTDYLDRNITGTTQRPVVEESGPVMEMVRYIEREYDVPVVGVSTGGAHWSAVALAPCMHDDWWEPEHTFDKTEPVYA